MDGSDDDPRRGKGVKHSCAIYSHNEPTQTERVDFPELIVTPNLYWFRQNDRLALGTIRIHVSITDSLEQPQLQHRKYLLLARRVDVHVNIVRGNFTFAQVAKNVERDM